MSKILMCLAVPALVAAGVVYERATHCRGSVEASTAVSDEGVADSGCCVDGFERSCRACAVESVSASEKSVATEPAAAERDRKADTDREIVFKAQGLTCPAVKGIGCGHMLFPVLGRLDKLDGVAGTSANYTGTLVRVSLSAGAERAKVEAAARAVLAEDAGDATALTGDDLRKALEREQWRAANRVGELSEIEFHTVALHRFRTFAEAEKLDKATADKLTAIAERQWKIVVKEAAAGKSNTPPDWGRRCKKAVGAVVGQAKDILTAEQITHLKEALMTPCRGEDRPVAPAQPIKTKEGQ